MVILHPIEGGAAPKELKIDLTPVDQYWSLIYSEGGGSTSASSDKIVFHPPANWSNPMTAIWSTGEYLTQNYTKLTINMAGHLGCWWGFSHTGDVYFEVIGIDEKGNEYMIERISLRKLTESNKQYGPYDVSHFPKIQFRVDAEKFAGDTCIAWFSPQYAVLSGYKAPPVCTAVMDYYDYKIEGKWLKIDIKSSMYPANTGCQLVNGITYDKGPVKQITVYRNGRGTPLDEGYMWVEYANASNLETSASIPLVDSGTYRFTLDVGTLYDNKIKVDSSVDIEVKYVAPASVSTQPISTTSPTQTVQEKATGFLSKYWWVIPLGIVGAIAVIYKLDPPSPLVVELANSKWARDLASAYVNPNLPPEEREKAIKEVAMYLASRMATHIASELA